jgi:hypothetical protein
MGVITTLQQYELKHKQIKGPAMTPSRVSPRSATIIDQTLKLSGKIDGSEQKQSRKCTRRNNEEEKAK